MKKLIFFTASFPYGLGQMWKANELAVFNNFFSKITVVPFSYGGNVYNPKPLPKNVFCERPLFETYDLSVSKRDIFRLLDEDCFYYFREFFVSRVFISKQRVMSWLSASLLVKRLKRHPYIRKLLLESDENTVLYFYWGRGTCEVLPFLESARFNKAVVRMHRYDLFEDRNNWYIPFRKVLLKSVTFVTPTSQAGYNHIACMYPKFESKLRVMRCGTTSSGVAVPSGDGVLRIVTCAILVPRKRVHLLVEALHKLRFRIEWTHIGDGDLMDDIKARTSSLPSNIKVNLLGKLDSRSVSSYYVENPADIFINTSSSEGVPFSVMEALSAGIPVIATDVGGTGEIVDDTVGKLLPADITADLLATTIEEFYHRPDEEKVEIRGRAFERYLERCNSINLAEEMAHFLNQ